MMRPILRGAIDQCTAEEVDGWIVSEAVDLRDRAVLAFVGERCVGMGLINKFRQDLLDVGLGDGYAGFHFSVLLQPPEDVRSIVIKIEGSDFVLLQQNAGGSSPPRSGPMDVYNPDAVEWMRARGWLSPEEFDAVRTLVRFGVYDRSLVRQAVNGQAEPVGDADARNEAANLVALLGFCSEETRDVEIKTDDIATFLRETPRRIPVVALSARYTGRVTVVEGSHSRTFGSETDFTAAIEYQYGRDRILFLDTRCLFRFEPTSNDKIQVMFG